MNEMLGEIWYELKLKSENPPPYRLDSMRAEQGSAATQMFTLENPIRQEVAVTGSISNPKSFNVEPLNFVLPPLGAVQVQLTYTPQKLVMTEV